MLLDFSQYVYANADLFVSAYILISSNVQSAAMSGIFEDKDKHFFKVLFSHKICRWISFIINT